MFVDAEAFVRSNLPPAPSRVLEVGCGDGSLARRLDSAGYLVTAIDPEAPAGPMFVRTALEDLEIREPFDAIVANRSLHHIHDLPSAIRKMHSGLRDGGKLVLNEFAHERMDPPTARWYLNNEGSEVPIERFLTEWATERDGLHTSSAILAAVRRSFREEMFEWVPYAAVYQFKSERLVREEASLIASGEIAGLGYRIVGSKRSG